MLNEISFNERAQKFIMKNLKKVFLNTHVRQHDSIECFFLHFEIYLDFFFDFVKYFDHG